MKFIGNIIWFIFSGFWSWLVYTIIGLLLCITIIGIPVGKQLFKMGRLVAFPFGKEVDLDFSSHIILNILWAVFVGWELALSYLFSGIVLCITVIGIPFGLQAFKLVKLCFAPFGAKVN